jgi:mono/diheme cytochrome c family protein
MGRFLLGIIIGIVLVPVVVLAWFRLGHPPVVVADPPLPFERWITQIPLDARINQRARPAVQPVEANEANFVAGARIYHDQCSACHGFYGKPSSIAAHMYPDAPQLWQKHQDNEAVGVSDNPPDETVWKVENGIRLTGMPSFNHVLTETQIWQVSLLLANADKPLPPAALALVRGEQQQAAPPNAPAPGH